MSENLPGKVRSVIVVGAGLAGIAAALALARQGIKVTVLERRLRLGGRVGSFSVHDDLGDEVEKVDYCQHIGMGCCWSLKQLIAWLDQQDSWQTQKQLHFFGPSGQYQLLRALPLLPAPLHLAGWLARWPGLTLRDRMAIARSMLALRKLKPDATTESLSALQWLHSIRQSPTAIRAFWQTIIVSALGEELGNVSLAAVVKVIQDGFLNHRDAFHLLVPQQPLGELFGNKAMSKLEQLGATIHLGQSANSIECNAANSIRVDCGSKCFEANAVIIAIPWHQLPRIAMFPSSPQWEEVVGRAQQLRSSPITGVHTWWDRAWLDQPHAAIVGRLCQWVFPKHLASTPKARQIDRIEEFYYQVVISASRELRGKNSDEIAELIDADLKQVFPAVRQAKLLRCKIVTDPQAVFSVSPGTTALRPNARLCAGVALAGDWTNTGWPATMEGAILSGFRAAATIGGDGAQ